VIATAAREAPNTSAPARRLPTALVIGPLPPPYHGGAIATQTLLASAVTGRFRLLHLDTTDRRGFGNMGRLEAGNIALALRHLVRYLRLLREEPPDLVYVPLAQNRLGFLRDALFLLPARLLGKRVVVHVHGGGFRDFFEGTDPLTRAIVRVSLARVSRAIVLGERLRPMMAELVPAERVAAVPNGIDDPYHGQLRPRTAEEAAARAELRVVYLGTLMEAKGFLDVLEAATLLGRVAPHARFIFAGDFFRPADRARAERLRGENPEVRADFPGTVATRAKAELLRDADIFVFPTRYANEGHPYVILEAMAAGLPIVTTARAAIAETVVHGETGIIVPEGEPAALADALRTLIADAPLRARLGAAARERFLQRYMLNGWAAEMAGIFEEALAA
jgi:glycosyltransferase involved in cell wall biosynthesis